MPRDGDEGGVNYGAQAFERRASRRLSGTSVMERAVHGHLRSYANVIGHSRRLLAGPLTSGQSMSVAGATRSQAEDDWIRWEREAGIVDGYRANATYADKAGAHS